MKKITLIIILIFCFATIAFADCESATIAGAPGASGTFTTAVSPNQHFLDDVKQNPKTGHLNVSVYGASWSATVFLQRSFDGTNYYDVAEFTSNEETSIYDISDGVRYRIGVKNGGYSSGSVLVQLCW